MIYQRWLRVVGEYLQNQMCPGGAGQCAPCEQRIPSCAGLENGNNSFPGRDNFYIVCQVSAFTAWKSALFIVI